MQLEFTRKMSKTLSSTSKIKCNYGVLADPIIKKLKQIAQISDYRELWQLPGNFHKLKYQTEGVFAVTLKHPYRLIMRLEDNHCGVCVLDINDYHDNPKIIVSYN